MKHVSGPLAKIVCEFQGHEPSVECTIRTSSEVYQQLEAIRIRRYCPRCGHVENEVRRLLVRRCR